MVHFQSPVGSPAVVNWLGKSSPKAQKGITFSPAPVSTLHQSLTFCFPCNRYLCICKGICHYINRNVQTSKTSWCCTPPICSHQITTMPYLANINESVMMQHDVHHGLQSKDTGLQSKDTEKMFPMHIFLIYNHVPQPFKRYSSQKVKNMYIKF